MILTVTILQAFVFFGYLTLIYDRFGLLESVSHSTYEWVGNRRYRFMAMCWTLAILNLFQGMGVWGVATTVGLLATGVTLDWKGDVAWKNWMHLIGAVTAILSGLLGLYFVHGMVLPIVLFLASCYPMYRVSRHYVWWLEVIAVALILIGYAMRWT